MTMAAFDVNMKAYALGAIRDAETGEPLAYNSTEEAVKVFLSAYRDEFDTSHARRLWPDRVERVEQFIKGLPDCLMIAFDDQVIAGNVMPSLGYPAEDCTPARYWRTLAAALVELCEEVTGEEFA